MAVGNQCCTKVADLAFRDVDLGGIGVVAGFAKFLNRPIFWKKSAGYLLTKRADYQHFARLTIFALANLVFT